MRRLLARIVEACSFPAGLPTIPPPPPRGYRSLEQRIADEVVDRLRKSGAL